MRKYTTVAIFDDTKQKMVAHFILYTRGHISLAVDNGNNGAVSGGPCTEWRFHEWFSFAYLQGHSIVVRLCDDEMRTTRTVEFKRS